MLGLGKVLVSVSAGSSHRESKAHSQLLYQDVLPTTQALGVPSRQLSPSQAGHHEVREPHAPLCSQNVLFRRLAKPFREEVPRPCFLHGPALGVAPPFLKTPFQPLLPLSKYTARWARLAFLFLF